MSGAKPHMRDAVISFGLSSDDNERFRCPLLCKLIGQKASTSRTEGSAIRGLLTSPMADILLAKGGCYSTVFAGLRLGEVTVECPRKIRRSYVRQHSPIGTIREGLAGAKKNSLFGMSDTGDQESVARLGYRIRF